MGDVIRCAFLGLCRKPVRSLLTVTAVAIGAASVIIINIISTCGVQAVNNEMNSLGMGGVLISPADETSAGISYDDVIQVKSVAGVDKASPVLLMSGKVLSSKEETDAYVWGIDSTARDVISLDLMYGRYINKSDTMSDSAVCMVDNSFARSVYGRDNIVGKTVTVSCSGFTENLRVVGVIKTGSGLLQNLMGTYIPNFIYTPYSNVQQALSVNGYHRIIVKTSDGADADSVSERIISRLEMNTGTTDMYTATNLVKQKESLSNIMDIVSFILSCVGAVALFVASIGIMTIMLVSVNERTREIGIKKSIGAKKSDIISEFLCEAVLLSVIGCLSGLIISFGAVLIAKYVLDLTISISWSSILPVMLLSVITGVVFGVYPAYRAASLNPVDALRR